MPQRAAKLICCCNELNSFTVFFNGLGLVVQLLSVGPEQLHAARHRGHSYWTAVKDRLQQAIGQRRPTYVMRGSPDAEAQERGPQSDKGPSGPGCTSSGLKGQSGIRGHQAW